MGVWLVGVYIHTYIPVGHVLGWLVGMGVDGWVGLGRAGFMDSYCRLEMEPGRVLGG